MTITRTRSRINDDVDFMTFDEVDGDDSYNISEAKVILKRVGNIY